MEVCLLIRVVQWNMRGHVCVIVIVGYTQVSLSLGTIYITITGRKVSQTFIVYLELFH